MRSNISTAKTTLNEFDIAGKLNSLKNLKISSIAQKMDWPISSLRTLLKQKGILKTKDDYLTEKEFKLTKKMLRSRLRGLHDSERSIAYFQNATKSYQETPHSYNFDDVYSKIRRYGLGKVIYTRKS